MVFGARASNIGNYIIPNIMCGHCQNVTDQRVSIFGKYLHVFWIPVFPIGKKAVAECVHCKKTIKHKDFPNELNNLYNQTHKQIKRPLWHMIGLGILGFLIAFIAFIVMTAERDSRSELLFADQKLMATNPTMKTDSISFKMKMVFDSIVSEEIMPSEFEYLTKIKEDKALIIVKVPKLKKVEKEARPGLLEMVELIANDQEDLQDKKLYIGIQGAISMMLIKTPTYEKNSRIALTSELYEYYGPKEIVEE